MKTILTALAVASLALVTGCGNQPDQGNIVKAITKGKLKTNRGAPAGTDQKPDLAAAISGALQKTDRPLTIAVVENRDSFAMLAQVGANKNYRTWASADRRTLITTRGVITATRGLGFDLMSADVSLSQPTVSARRSGATQRTLRFLDGENQTVEAAFSCNTKVSGSQTIAIGEVRSHVTTVVETCHADAGEQTFENTYQVSPSGYALQSRQWVGPQNGYIFTQAVRLN